MFFFVRIQGGIVLLGSSKMQGLCDILQCSTNYIYQVYIFIVFHFFN